MAAIRSMPGAERPPAPGLVQVLNLPQTLEREAQRALSTPALPAEIESGLTAQIRKDWETAKEFRVKTDIRLLECLRARRGTYSAAEMQLLQQQGGANVVWMDIADTKAQQAQAWISDVVMPAGERAWGIEAAPMPELPPELVEAVLHKAAYAARQAMVDRARAAGGTMDAHSFRALALEIGAGVRDEALKALRDNAAKRAERMEDRIGGHMAAGRYRSAMRDFIDYFVTYPTAVLKGPYFTHRDVPVWLPGWNLKVEQQARMSWSAVNPFDCYPAPNASSCQEGAFIERLRLRREQLYAMIGLPGYSEKAIRAALQDYRNGRNEAWLWSEMERRRYENDTIFDWLAPHGVIDALHWWGGAPGAHLIQWGMDPEQIDPEKEYQCDAILVGRYVIRAAINNHPLQRRPYHQASFSRVPGAFWGRSLYDRIKASQKMCNACASALADNMGMASGPMLWMYTDRLAPGFTDINPAPWKIYQLVSKKDGNESGANPGIGAINVQAQADQLMNVFKFFEERADFTSGVPRYFSGAAQDAPEVARVLAMLMSAAGKGLRQAITEIDQGVLEPSLYDCYLYEMLYGEDNAAKGDCTPVPRGAAAILVKDAQIENRSRALQIASQSAPIMQLIGERGLAELVREVYRMLEVPTDKIIPSDEALIAREKARQQAQQQGGGINPAQAQTLLLEKARLQTQRDLKAASIQKDLTVNATKHGLPEPPAMSPPVQTALGLEAGTGDSGLGKGGLALSLRPRRIPIAPPSGS